MTDSQEKKTNDSGDSRTINIEISANCFEGMAGMMARLSEKTKRGPNCCDSSRSRCCPQTGEEDKQEFKIVINRKEN